MHPKLCVLVRLQAEYQGEGDAGDPIELLDDDEAVVYDEEGNPVVEEGYEEEVHEEYAEGEEVEQKDPQPQLSACGKTCVSNRLSVAGTHSSQRLL